MIFERKLGTGVIAKIYVSENFLVLKQKGNGYIYCLFSFDRPVFRLDSKS